MTFAEIALNLGLIVPIPWGRTLAYGLGGLAALLAATPLADAIATRLVGGPLKLKAFNALKRSWAHLLVGVVVAWIVGGVIEEALLRGVVLRWIEHVAARHAPPLVAQSLGVLAAAALALAAHLYQGLRAALIVSMLSVVFGVIYVASGYVLWTVILAHGLYDTIAFVRFAFGWSKYSKAADA
jgi:hypothetical protein